MTASGKAGIVFVPTEDVLAKLRHDGYYVTSVSVGRADAVQFVLDVGRSLGELYVPKGCDPSQPVIRTAPAHTRRAAPFDRPEAIGWHGDFATYEDRPELSLVYITRPDPRGGQSGAWRLASVEDVLVVLRATDDGRAALDFLTSTSLPFSYSDDEDPRQFVVFERRPEPRTGLRFYMPSIRRGCLAVYGEMPASIATALAQVERAADAVARVVPTREG